MDILKLDPDTYLPTEIVEGFSSKIWTERFRTHGDFQFKSNRIAEIKAALPKGTFISHRDTRDVAMVEDLVETTAEDGAKEITVTGRCVTLILESRWVEGLYQKKRQMNRKYSAVGAALLLVWQAVDNNTGIDVTRLRKGKDNDGARWPWTVKDVLPNVIVTETTTGFPDEFPLKRWWLTEGLLYDQLMAILDRGDCGIRILRPDPNELDLEDVNRVSGNSDADSLGAIIRNSITQTSAMRFDIYQGIDRSHTQDDNEEVTFSVLNRLVTQPSYAESMRDWKTGVEMMSGEIEISDVYRGPEQAAFTGWDRRIVGLDVGTPEIPERPEDPGKNATADQENDYELALSQWREKRTDIITEFREDAIDEANRLLKQTRKLSLFSGNVAPSNPFIYKQHYDLGDIISLSGEYGATQRMVVQEYIRTDDNEGDRGFPGLVLP